MRWQTPRHGCGCAEFPRVATVRDLCSYAWEKPLPHHQILTRGHRGRASVNSETRLPLHVMHPVSETSVGVAERCLFDEFDGRVDDNDHLGLS